MLDRVPEELLRDIVRRAHVTYNFVLVSISRMNENVTIRNNIEEPTLKKYMDDQLDAAVTHVFPNATLMAANNIFTDLSNVPSTRYTLNLERSIDDRDVQRICNNITFPSNVEACNWCWNARFISFGVRVYPKMALVCKRAAPFAVPR